MLLQHAMEAVSDLLDDVSNINDLDDKGHAPQFDVAKIGNVSGNGVEKLTAHGRFLNLRVNPKRRESRQK